MLMKQSVSVWESQLLRRLWLSLIPIGLAVSGLLGTEASAWSPPAILDPRAEVPNADGQQEPVDPAAMVVPTDLRTPVRPVPAPAPEPDVDEILKLRRRLDEESKALEQLRTSLQEAVDQEETAETELFTLDRRYQELSQRIDAIRSGSPAPESSEPSEVGSPPSPPQGDPPTETLDPLLEQQKALAAQRELAKERYELALKRRITLTEQVAAQERSLETVRRELDVLRGKALPDPAAVSNGGGAKSSPEPPLRGMDGATSQPASTSNVQGAVPPNGPSTPVPIPAGSNGSPPSPPPSTALAPAPTLPGPLSSVPSLSATNTDTASPADPATGQAVEPSSPSAPEESAEVVQTRQETEDLASQLEEVRREAEDLRSKLDENEARIARETELIRNLRSDSDNARAERKALNQQLDQLPQTDENFEEIREARSKIVQADTRIERATREIRTITDRRERLNQDREELHDQLLTVQFTQSRLEEQLKTSQARLDELQSPWSWTNIRRWLILELPILGLIVLAMVTLTWLVNILSDRMVVLLASGIRRGSRQEREGRAATLVGVFENAFKLVVIGGGSLIILQEIGVPVGPLLGGAAVVGLAVAFGSQNLIRDYFYGFVILFENQYKIGDIVRIGTIAGQVERITLRMTVLRDLEGLVHFIPNGEITSVSNMTHGWSRALFDVGVAYKESVDQVIEVIQTLGRELRTDPEFSVLILEDLKMLGVDSLGDSGVVIKFFITTRPLEQWAIKREMLRRIKNRFDALGIEIPFPHRTVYHRFDDVEAAPEIPPIARRPAS